MRVAVEQKFTKQSHVLITTKAKTEEINRDRFCVRWLHPSYHLIAKPTRAFTLYRSRSNTSILTPESLPLSVPVACARHECCACSYRHVIIAPGFWEGYKERCRTCLVGGDGSVL